MNEWTNRRLRKNFISSINEMKTNKDLLMGVVSNRAGEILYKETEPILIQEISNGQKATISLKWQQVTEAAYEQACFHAEVAVMDFMGIDTPYENGKEITWEGELCRCTTLFPCLCTELVQQKFYQHNKSKGDLLGTNRAIYIPEVRLFSTELYRYPEKVNDIGYINIIGMAAPDMSRYSGEISKTELKNIIQQRIDRSFEIAYVNGNTSLVTGAWGCGECKCPSDIVAQAYSESLEKWQYYFKSIVFAINPYDATKSESLIYNEFVKKLSKYNISNI